MVALWTLLMLPVLLVLFAVIVEGVHLWLARVELENSLEAAALAAVTEWAETSGGPSSGWTANARLVGQQYAAANTINQTPVVIGSNVSVSPFDATANPNENGPCTGDLVFGAVVQAIPKYIVASSQAPECAGSARNHVVRAQARHEAPSLIGGFLGVNFGGPFPVSATATAMYDCDLKRPRLIRVASEDFHCPTGP